MLVKKTKEQKVYLLKLKTEVSEYLINFKKRYQLFPWNKVNKISKLHTNSKTPINVNGTDFTVKKLVKEIDMTKSKIQSRMRPSYYNYILRAYIKDSMNKEGKQLRDVYYQYKEELQGVFKEMKLDLMFCLEGLRQLNKTLKPTKQITESSSNKPGDREFVLLKTLEILKDNGKNPKVTPKEQNKWIQNETSDFNGSLCIAGLGDDGLSSLCSKVNAVIKPYGGKLSPDNYGTSFLSIQESEESEMHNEDLLYEESEDIIMDKLFLDSLTDNEKEILFESVEYISMLESEELTESVEDELVLEGSNIDLVVLYNREVTEAKKGLKEAKKMMAKKNYKEAIKKFKEVQDSTEKIKKYVADANDTAIEKIIGSFAFVWRNYIFDIVRLGTFAIDIGITIKNTKKIAGIARPKAPTKPDVFLNQDYNWKTQEWELNKLGLKKMKQYNEDMIKYEEKLISYKKDVSAVVGKSRVVSGVLTGIGLLLQIAKVIDTLIAMTKVAEGSNKLLEQDMDKEHWDRMRTKSYNPMRAYIYQICDEIVIICKRCISKIEKYHEEDLKEETVEFNEFMNMKFVNENGEFEDARDFVLSLYESIELEDGDDEITESSDVMSKSVYKNMRNQIRDLSKKYRKSMKQCKYAEAKNHLTEIKKVIDQSEKDIKAFKINGSSITLDNVVDYLFTISRYIYVLIPVEGTFVSKFKNYKEQMNKLEKIDESIKKTDDITDEDCAKFKSQLLDYIKALKDAVNNLMFVVNNEEKIAKRVAVDEAKAEKEMKESAEFRAEKLAIYEACNRGEITVEEREELFQNLKDRMYVSEAYTDDEVLLEERGMSNKEKFEKVRSVLYERCNKGELTVEQRENLIMKAKEMIFAEAVDKADKDEDVDINKVADEVSKEAEKEVKSADQTE